MTAYSLDLRQRVLRARDSGMKVDAIAATFDVSVAWIYRLVQRRRETGSIAPRKQTKFRDRALSSDEEVRLVALITVKPDATLAELQQTLPTRAALSTLWRTIDRLGLTVKKNGTRRRAATPGRRRRSPTMAGHAVAARRPRLHLHRRIGRDH
jgi:transposase